MVEALSHCQTHDYQKFSEQYSDIGIEGSYYLAFSTVPQLIEKYVYGRYALDFGCGPGRSTRFLQALGFQTVGVDVSPPMLAQAERIDPNSSYYLIDTPHLPFEPETFDFVFQSFVLFEYPSINRMHEALKEIHRVLAAEGTAIIITGSEEYYSHDWASFQNNVPENQMLQSGDKARVSIRGTDIVLLDYYWSDRDYQTVFKQSGFDVVEVLRPLAKGHEPFEWFSELEHPCWAIYLLKKAMT